MCLTVEDTLVRQLHWADEFLAMEQWITDLINGLPAQVWLAADTGCKGMLTRLCLCLALSRVVELPDAQVDALGQSIGHIKVLCAPGSHFDVHRGPAGQQRFPRVLEVLERRLQPENQLRVSRYIGHSGKDSRGRGEKHATRSRNGRCFSF